MKPFTKGLDTETQLLIAVGSAVASGCIPCLESITGMARAESIDEKKMRAAAIIGQFVKDQPAGHMKAKADALLGTHLQAASNQVECPMESNAPKSAGETAELTPASGCGCS
ncbi:MAG: carboxymuconolactone decarboxylase family protein [Desulfobacterales bacterium]|nr:carboxymuconolactone decarboxylase family protein [Desulfobacterales bacterium]